MTQTQSYLIRKFKQYGVKGIMFIKTYKAPDGHYIWNDLAISNYDKVKRVCRIQLMQWSNNFVTHLINRQILQINSNKQCEFELPWDNIGQTYLTLAELEHPKYSKIFELIFVQILQIISKHKNIKYNDNVLFEKDSQYNMLIECDLEVT